MHDAPPVETPVRIHRPHTILYRAVTFDVHLDGRIVGAVRDEEVLDLSVPAGPHELQVMTRNPIHRLLDESSAPVAFRATGVPVCLTCGPRLTMADLLVANAGIVAAGQLLLRVFVTLALVAGAQAMRDRMLVLRIVDCGDLPAASDAGAAEPDARERYIRLMDEVLGDE